MKIDLFARDGAVHVPREDAEPRVPAPQLVEDARVARLRMADVVLPGQLARYNAGDLARLAGFTLELLDELEHLLDVVELAQGLTGGHVAWTDAQTDGRRHQQCNAQGASFAHRQEGAGAGLTWWSPSASKCTSRRCAPYLSAASIREQTEPTAMAQSRLARSNDLS